MVLILVIRLTSQVVTETLHFAKGFVADRRNQARALICSGGASSESKTAAAASLHALASVVVVPVAVVVMVFGARGQGPRHWAGWVAVSAATVAMAATTARTVARLAAVVRSRNGHTDDASTVKALGRSPWPTPAAPSRCSPTFLKTPQEDLI